MGKPAENGVILISVLIIVSVLTVIGISVASYSATEYAQSNQNVFDANAMQAAEAGIEQSVEQLNNNDNFAGYGAAQTFFNTAAQGRGTFTTVIAGTSNTNAKTITSTGLIYRYNSTKVVSKRKVKVTVVGTGSAGYSLQTGAGGVILGGSASITNTDVYINGTLSLTGTSKIGTAAQPVNVYVANQACPSGTTPGSSYPQVCSSGQPISLAQSTNIYGTVCATGQTSTGPNNNIKPGTSSGSGLKAGCTAPPVTTPTYDRAAHINAVTTTASGTSNSYVCTAYPFNRTWPANLKLTGNATVDGSCNIVIKGNAYITGDLTLGGASKITVDNSVGTTRPVVIVDGKLTVGNSAQLVANNVGTGIQFISFKSSASCSPACTSLSGNDLKTSQAFETVNIGGAVNMPGMIFQSYWGKLTLAGSGSVGSALGQTVDMSGAGTITFGTTLSSGSHTWTITSYQQVYN